MNNLSKLIIKAAQEKQPLPPTRSEFIEANRDKLTASDIEALQRAQEKRNRKLNKKLYGNQT